MIRRAPTRRRFGPSHGSALRRMPRRRDSGRRYRRLLPPSRRRGGNSRRCPSPAHGDDRPAPGRGPGLHVKPMGDGAVDEFASLATRLRRLGPAPQADVEIHGPIPRRAPRAACPRSYPCQRVAMMHAFADQPVLIAHAEFAAVPVHCRTLALARGAAPPAQATHSGRGAKAASRCRYDAWLASSRPTSDWLSMIVLGMENPPSGAIGSGQVFMSQRP